MHAHPPQANHGRPERRGSTGRNGEHKVGKVQVCGYFLMLAVQPSDRTPPACAAGFVGLAWLCGGLVLGIDEVRVIRTEGDDGVIVCDRGVCGFVGPILGVDGLGRRDKY
eukprot:1137474-Pelagomonas_calceolata.AAC.2